MRLPQSKMETLVGGQDPYVTKDFPSPNKVPIPSDSLQFVRQNSLELIVSFKIQKYKVAVEKLKPE